MWCTDMHTVVQWICMCVINSSEWDSGEIQPMIGDYTKQISYFLPNIDRLLSLVQFATYVSNLATPIAITVTWPFLSAAL